MRFIKFLSISYFMQVQETQRSYQAKCHTPFREIGNEASIRVPRMFKSHAWQQYDKQMQCY
jgi:hypothetical protein